MEEQFTRLLKRLTPQPKYMRLFSAVVEDVWRDQCADLLQARERAKSEVAELEAKRDRVFDLFCEGSLDQPTYRTQTGRIDAQLKEQNSRLADLEPDDLDVGELLKYAESVVFHAVRAWTAADVEDRRLLQKALFPEGVIYANGQLGTAKKSLFFERLSAFEHEKQGLVDLTGFEPVTS